MTEKVGMKRANRKKNRRLFFLKERKGRVSKEEEKGAFAPFSFLDAGIFPELGEFLKSFFRSHSVHQQSFLNISLETEPFAPYFVIDRIRGDLIGFRISEHLRPPREHFGTEVWVLIIDTGIYGQRAVLFAEVGGVLRQIEEFDELPRHIFVFRVRGDSPAAEPEGRIDFPAGSYRQRRRFVHAIGQEVVQKRSRIRVLDKNGGKTGDERVDLFVKTP